MSRIQQLSPQVISRIAAGEVIERPASVLKELLENSIDAGSTRVDISIGQGGLEFLRVADNGCGIEPEDFPLAFAAHATSKLRCAEDLDRIGTLGFRGEGLASIASVSQVCLQSRRPDASHGYEMRCDGGVLSSLRPWNGTPGTRIEVRQLFYNTPVRRKFLRGVATEMSHLHEVFVRLGLSQLSLHLTLEHNGRKTCEIPASAGLLDRIALLFGEELRRNLLILEAEQSEMTLGGYVASPATDHGGTQMQYLFVNGRWVRDRFLSQALQEAYRGLLMTGKHPIAFLFLELAPDAVDVNVHPTKAEVRFRQPEKVRRFVEQVVRQHLQTQDLITPVRARSAPSTLLEPALPQAELPFESSPVSAVSSASTASPSPSITRQVTERASRPLVVSTGSVPQVEKVEHPLRPLPAPVRPAPPVSTCKAIQMHDLYLLVEVPEGILILDQHALHERILFEDLKHRLSVGMMERQKLLIPEPISLTALEAALVLEHAEALGELGLEVRDFGGGTVLLEAYPAVLGKRSPRSMLQALIQYLTTQQRPPTREALLHDLLALMACHAAVRAGDRLTAEEIQELLKKKHLVQDTHHCPHGRPSSLLFTRDDLDRQFGRTG